MALAAIIVSGTGHAQAPGTWQTKAPIPIGRYGSPSAVIDGKLFVASGCCQDPFDPFPLRFNDVRVYDPASDTWSTRAPIPVPLYAAPNGVIDGRWYLAGGQPCCQNIATLQIYDPVLDQWTTGPPVPDASGAGVGGVINGQLFVAGGMNAANTFPVATLRVFDPLSNTWHAGASMPAARANMAGAVLDGHLYVVGGGDGGVVHNDLYVYDPALDSWTVGPPMPTPRYLLGAAAFGGKLYAFGGYDNVTRFAIVEIFDPLTNTWSAGPSMPEPHVLPATGVIDNALYVVGGFDATSPVGSTNNVFVLDQPKTTPSITVFGGTFTYNAFSHPATASALDAGNPVAGSFAFTYTPGGAMAPVTPGTYQVDATFTPQDPNSYTTATGTGSIVITPSQAVVNGPSSVVAEATSPAGAVPSFFVSAFDFDGSLTPSCTPLGPGSTFPLGTTQVTCTAQGANSTPGSASFPVTVRDTQAPGIGSVSNITTPATSSQGAIVTFSLPSVSDAADPHPSVSASPASGSLFPHGTTTVTVTARDASGNTSTKSFSVTVTAALVSISVSPSSATISPGSSRQFSATGLFTDGSSRQLPSGSSGGSGGNNGPGNFPWQVRFLPTFAVTPCSTLVNGGLSSQGLGSTNGAVSMNWGPSNILHVTGTITPSTVTLSIACATSASPAPPVLSLSAAWTGTRYEGSFVGYGGETVNVRITGWSSQAAMPTARFALGAATLTVNGHDVVYTVGGATSNSLLSAVEAYDPATNSWSAAPPLPVAREGAGVVAANNLLYVAGGTAPGGVPTGRVDVFDPAANAWSNTLPSLSVPRSHFSLVAAGNALYAIGGNTAPANSSVTNTVERLDLSQPGLGWTMVSPMPTARNFTAAGALNNGALIVVVGGSQGGGPLSRTELYNVSTNTWTQGPGILAPTAAPASAVVQNALFVFGGTSNGPLTLAELYRPASGQQPDGWAALSGMPTARSEAAAAAVGDVIYVAGGQTNASPGGAATFEAFSILEPNQFSLSQGGGGGGTSGPTVTWRVAPVGGVATISSSGNAFGSAPGQVTVIAESGTISCLTTNRCGSLTVANTAPSVAVFGGDQTVDAGATFSASGGFFDPDNGQSWTATVDYGDGGGPQPLALAPAPQPGPTGTFTLAHAYPRLGSFTATVTVSDNAGGHGTATVTVFVVDRVPPVIDSVTPSLTTLAPPNHKMVPVSIGVHATDNVDPSPVCEVVAVASNEAANGLGDGNTPADWSFAPGSLTVLLRAERSGTGTGRIYTIMVRCHDASGNASTATTTVNVPK